MKWFAFFQNILEVQEMLGMNAKGPENISFSSEGEVIRQENCPPPIPGPFHDCSPQEEAMEDLQPSIFTFFFF